MVDIEAKRKFPVKLSAGKLRGCFPFRTAVLERTRLLVYIRNFFCNCLTEREQRVEKEG